MNYLYRAFWLLILISGMMHAQDKPAYRIFTSAGKAVSYGRMEAGLADADVICFGELHNNPIAHWLQLELCDDLIARRGSAGLLVGAEMIESNQQASLDEYLRGATDSKAFESANKLWNNYATDYRPVVELCRSAGVPFVAGNVPRTYARLVSRQGAAALDTLPAEEKALLCPLPYPIDYQLPAYAAMRDMFAGHGGGMNPDNFIAAQALKDATMAWRLLAALSSGKQALHLNGSYHSDFHEGMVWYLQHYRPGIRVLTISLVEQEELDRLDTENLKRADFIIVVPAKMTKTYLTED